MDELSSKREEKRIKKQNNINIYQILSRIKNVQDGTYTHISHKFDTEEGKRKLQEYLGKYIQGKYAFLSNVLENSLKKDPPVYSHMSLFVIESNDKFYEELYLQVTQSLRIPANQILFKVEELIFPASILFYDAEKGEDTGVILYPFDNFVIECD